MIFSFKIKQNTSVGDIKYVILMENSVTQAFLDEVWTELLVPAAVQQKVEIVHF
jgi:hypothetical protein